MEFTSQEVVGVVGVIVTLPPTMLILWTCWSRIKRNKELDRGSADVQSSVLLLVGDRDAASV
ncbi:hypothetical protein PG996_006648 [Apiospora saccharicola]|uniref:Uncharacterized protein n=1 Tax=Apiospora saccharicola TaxID=335842 RepID=A0ABR1VB42_9PEZI